MKIKRDIFGRIKEIDFDVGELEQLLRIDPSNIITRWIYKFKKQEENK